MVRDLGWGFTAQANPCTLTNYLVAKALQSSGGNVDLWYVFVDK